MAERIGVDCQLPRPEGRGCDLPNGTYAWADFYTIFTSENLKIYPRRYLSRSYQDKR